MLLFFIFIIGTIILGNKENSTHIQEPLNKNNTTWIKNQYMRNNCQHVTTTVSLDAFSFPTDNQNLERVKTSPNLIFSNASSSQKSEISIDMDVTRRERIDRYKEERRLALRERFKTSESVLYDDEIIIRLKAKSLKSPDECTDSNICTSTRQPKHLVKITTYDERVSVTNDSGQKEWYTRSLERKNCAKRETKGLVASRVNQLIGCTNSSDVIINQNTSKTIDKPISKYILFTNH